jgi:3'(2'), 5'-bisphosphate nucleotidase
MWPETNVRARVLDEVRDSLGENAAIATDIVADALGLVRSVEASAAAEVFTKADASPVTVADFGVQVLVASRLARECPGDCLVAEEDASPLRTEQGHELLQRITGLLAGRMAEPITPEHVLDYLDRGGGSAGRRFWTLDPIDGTKGLLRGGQYAVALALVIDGAVQCGVIGCPRLSLDTARVAGPIGGLAVAARRRGSWWCGVDGKVRPLRVSSAVDPGVARVLHSNESAHSDVAWFLRTLARLGVTNPPILMDSQAKHVALAAGVGDVLLRFPPKPGYHEAIWDQAAGLLVIEEAGGRITDLTGHPLDITPDSRLTRNHGIVASNSRLHPAVIAAVSLASADLHAGRGTHTRPASSACGRRPAPAPGIRLARQAAAKRTREVCRDQQIDSQQRLADHGFGAGPGLGHGGLRIRPGRAAPWRSVPLHRIGRRMGRLLRQQRRARRRQHLVRADGGRRPRARRRGDAAARRHALRRLRVSRLSVAVRAGGDAAAPDDPLRPGVARPGRRRARTLLGPVVCVSGDDLVPRRARRRRAARHVRHLERGSAAVGGTVERHPAPPLMRFDGRRLATCEPPGAPTERW